MSAVEDGTIVNNINSKKFIFRALAPFRNKKTQPTSAIPLINRAGSANILFRFVGQTEEITFTFMIFDDGTDVSGGTDASSPTTVDEQIRYLRDAVFTEDFDDTWTLTQSMYYPSGVSGVITDVEFDSKAGARTIATGSFSFKLGRIAKL